MQPSRKRKLRRLTIALSVLCVVMLVAIPIYRHYDRISMVETTLLWSRMNPIPATVQDFSIRTQGSMFSRTFIATFTATPAEIQAWLDSSPGTAGLQPTTTGTLRTYSIRPGGGANGARVTVDDVKNTVELYAEWS